MGDPLAELPALEEYKAFVGGIPFHFGTRELQAGASCTRSPYLSSSSRIYVPVLRSL
jgi:hypothetical protein